MRRPFLLPGPDVGRLLLDRLVAEGVRYGRDFALLPATDRAGADRAAQRLREAIDSLISVGAAHWVGDTAHDLLSRAEPRR